MSGEQKPRRDGLHCVYGECQGFPKFPRPCNPGCSFTLTMAMEFDLLGDAVEWVAEDAKSIPKEPEQ